MIVAIESSCDESALAIFDDTLGLTGEWVHSQLELHGHYGGVVPDLASREHLRNFPRLLQEMQPALAGQVPRCVAVTHGPGLAGCLALGLSLAKSLGLAWQVPVMGVNHLRGHAFSPFIRLHRENPANFRSILAGLLPHLGLIVSGGNTLLCAISAPDHQSGFPLQVLAQTEDDAAGEALDKGAKLLGLPYPGGPHIERLARHGHPTAIDFPRAFPSAGDFRFSFSGLKTSLRYYIEKLDDDTLAQQKADICASYQQAVVDALIRKTGQALRTGRVYRSLGLSGGVANNQTLRSAFSSLASRHRIPGLIAEPRHTGDNAGMIAFAAYLDPGSCLENKDQSLSIAPSLTL